MNVNFYGILDLNGNEIINVSKILGMDGKWSLDENGKLVVREIETEKIKSQKGYTVPDEDTGIPYCIKVKSGALVAAEGKCEVTAAAEGTATNTSP